MQNFRALGAPSPDPQNSPLIANSGYAPAFVTVDFIFTFAISVSFWGILKFYRNLGECGIVVEVVLRAAETFSGF